MTFADLKAGDSVFLDANTLVYHFTADAAFADRLHPTPAADRESGPSRFYFHGRVG